MFSFAKFFADIAARLGASTGVISHGLVLIFAVGITIPATSYFSKQNEKIETVPELSSKLDTIQHQLTSVTQKFDKFIIDNKIGHDSLNGRIYEVKNALIKSREIQDQKFNYLDKNLKEKFLMPDNWLDEILLRISDRDIKKNFNPYQLSLIQ